MVCWRRQLASLMLRTACGLWQLPPALCGASSVKRRRRYKSNILDHIAVCNKRQKLSGGKTHQKTTVKIEIVDLTMDTDDDEDDDDYVVADVDDCDDDSILSCDDGTIAHMPLPNTPDNDDEVQVLDPRDVSLDGDSMIAVPPIVSIFTTSSDDSTACTSTPTTTANGDAPVRAHSDDDDPEISVIGIKRQVQFIHMRQHCTNAPFVAATANTTIAAPPATTTTATINARHCSGCYCYVCDCPASDCAQWNNNKPNANEQEPPAQLRHCCATDRGPHATLWKALRRESKKKNRRR